MSYAYNPNGGWTATHQMSIHEKFDDITRQDLLEFAHLNNIKDAAPIIDEVCETASKWPKMAQECDVPKNDCPHCFKHAPRFINQKKLNRQHIIHGLRDDIPIALGYFAVTFSHGIIAARAGLTAPLGFLSSFFTRASAGEYGTYTLVAVQAAYVEVIAMCLVANLRYMLMSAALSQKIAPGTSWFHRILMACCVTDKVFGISVAHPGYTPPAYTYSAALISTLFWASGCAVGIVAGSLLPQPMVTALSMSLYGMFLAIIIPPAHKDRNVGINEHRLPRLAIAHLTHISTGKTNQLLMGHLMSLAREGYMKLRLLYMSVTDRIVIQKSNQVIGGVLSRITYIAKVEHFYKFSFAFFDLLLIVGYSMEIIA